MGKVSKFLQETIKGFNVFSSPVNLRYDLDPDYNTFAGGCVSVGLIILLMTVFYSAWISLLNKQTIISSTQTQRQFDPQLIEVNTDDFMFAIGVSGFNLSDTATPRYFQLDFQMRHYINGTGVSETLTLSTCTEQHWEQLGSQFVQTHNRHSLSNFLCPPRNKTIQFAGKYTSEQFIYSKISLKRCSTNCKTSAQLSSYIASNKAFYLNFYYSNTLLNPDHISPISKFFEDKDYFLFSDQLGVSTNLYLGQYIMDTDESIYPWTEENIQSGYIISRSQKQSWDFILPAGENFAELFLRKSNIRYQIDRKFQKIDEMLSYIGGLFGLITIAFGFVMNYYGQCSFQLEMCQKIFNYKNQNDCGSSESSEDKYKEEKDKAPIIEPQQFGFLDYFLHLLYGIIRKFCNFEWHRMKIYEESLEEIRYKLDISQIVEKLAFYDRSFTTLFDEHQLKLLYLQQKFNFSEVREQRQMLAMRHDIIANLFGLQAGDQIKEQNLSDEPRPLTLEEKEKQKSRKKLKTFIGKSFNFIEEAIMVDRTKDGEDDIVLPPDIKRALQKLQNKIEDGDEVSIRIYNGLQYELLEAFEKSKLKKTKHCVTGRKLDRKVKLTEDTNNNQEKGRRGGKIKLKSSKQEPQFNETTRSIQNFF